MTNKFFLFFSCPRNATFEAATAAAAAAAVHRLETRKRNFKGNAKALS